MVNPQPDGTKGPVPVVGLPVQNKDRPPMRMEIREMKKNPKLWALFLLGLEKFKSTDETDPLSYFQIGGIHGAPLTTWPNQAWNNEKVLKPAPEPYSPGPMDTDAQGNYIQFGGFCTHTSVLFLPWHRPYLALWEAQLYRHVNDVARDFGGDYVDLAKDFRMPYWDFCTPGTDKQTGFLPVEVLSPVPSIKWPNGKPLTVNPLSKYNYGTTATNDSIITKIFQSNNTSTVRWPNPKNGNQTDETNLFTQFQRSLASFQADSKSVDPKNFKYGLNLTERSAYILLAYQKFAPMSDNLSNSLKLNAKWANFGSLEDVHNTVHGAVGGNGNMGQVGIAAFDPIFWMHHANIDRLWAIWQALWDDGKEDTDYKNATYVTEQDAGSGTFSTLKSTPQNINTDLTPFSASEKLGDFIKPRGARYTTNYGYVYPETRSWTFSTQRQIYNELIRLYGLPNLASIITAKNFDDTKKLVQPVVSNLQTLALTHMVTKKVALTTSAMLKAVEPDSSAGDELFQKVAAAAEEVQLPANRSVDQLTKDNKYLEWLVDVKAEKHASGGDYQVHFFIGQPDDSQPYYYMSDPRHVSFFSSFGSGSDTGCEKCREGQTNHTKVTGQIPLTMALVERYLAGQVDGLDPEHVIPFLRENLHWRASKPDGTILQRSSVDGLLVVVVTNEVTVPTDPGRLPVYASSVVPRPEITANRGDGTGVSAT